MVLCLVAVCLIFVFQIVNKGIKDTSEIKAEESFTTKELLLQLHSKDEKLEGFIEKAIEIKGEIKEITHKGETYSLILKGSSETAYILCQMQTDQNGKVKQLKPGQKIKLKGILKGFLMDIILLHCVII